MNDKQPSTDPYKGVRDFYPEEQFIQRYIYDLMRFTAEEFGYVEYDASILEPSELFEAKSSEEIVNEQTYTFEDRGGRRVTLRPEMTPTVARMVAKKRKELAFPLRWYSLPNVFRYERPQKGRLREHIQLNVDLFGIEGIDAELEIIDIARSLLTNAGAEQTDFAILVNDRRIINELFDHFELSIETAKQVSRLVDGKAKMSEEEFLEKLQPHLSDRRDEFVSLLTDPDKLRGKLGAELFADIDSLVDTLQTRGITNVSFDPTLMRGFDYYTGIVFEVFDTNPENNRSLFGGGRYDKLLAEFGVEPVPTVGFGMGDVTMKEFLAFRNLLPEYQPTAELYLCRLDRSFANEVHSLATKLRDDGVNVIVDLTDRKVGDQIKTADKAGIPFVICIGKEEVDSKQYTLKHLPSTTEKTVSADDIASTMIEIDS